MEWLGATLKPYDLLPKNAGQSVTPPSAKAVTDSANPAAPEAGNANSDWHVSFDDLLDVVNPLQHFPVVGTLYRALTHDQIKTPEKIVGDTLYGGLWGLAGSVADTAFERITGHNFGDTVLAFVTGHHDDSNPVAVATAEKPAAAPSASAQPEPASPQAASADEAALASSLTKSGMNSDMAQRALYAYRRATGLPDQAALSPY